MSQDYDSNNAIEHTTAVAAAAYAIKSMEESAISGQKKAGNEPSTSLVRIKSKKEDTTISKPEPGRVSRIFSGLGSTRGTPERDVKVPISTATAGKTPEKAILPAPSVKKTATFSDKQLNSTDSVTPATAAAPTLRPSSIKKAPTFDDKQSDRSSIIKPETAAPKPDLSTTMKPAGPSNEIKRESSSGPGIRKTEADMWEEAEIATLKERYEKQQARILSWENKKKKKARNKLDRIESETQAKKAKALRKFSSDMEFIKQIAEGARAQAEERHRNEVFKVKQKANAIRRTGKVPKTCFCF